MITFLPALSTLFRQQIWTPTLLARRSRRFVCTVCCLVAKLTVTGRPQCIIRMRYREGVRAGSGSRRDEASQQSRIRKLEYRRLLDDRENWVDIIGAVKVEANR